ncbi:MAG TPA: fumarylacetoacetate hydrolase family protein [Beijerinckiaceae bacterium]|nr:fumarylacetoacetate hydrolase family protein [Beijerinckiaceae bacterium]
MRFATFALNGVTGLAAQKGDGALFGLTEDQSDYPGALDELIREGRPALASAHARLLKGDRIDLGRARLAPPLAHPGKIICVGLNYVDHSAESGFKQPDYPTLFARFASSLIGHGAPMIRPRVSTQLDFEGELVAIIGKGGRRIAKSDALDHVMGFSIFNDGSIRDYQMKTPQWTMGKNFDGTGPFGPYLVTADELPPGCKGLRLRTRLNGETVQSAMIDDMVFDVATLVSLISEGITLEPGDVLVTGTPSGVGLGRKPPLWMKPGDEVEVEIDQIGVLSNPIVDEAGATRE